VAGKVTPRASRATIRVHQPGLASLFVTPPELGYRAFGMPVGGPADRASWRMAQALLGNTLTWPVLEITLLGPTLETNATVTAVVVGGETRLQLESPLGPVGQEQALSAPRSGLVFHWPAGTILRVSEVQQGCRAYLALAGGWQPKVNDSTQPCEGLLKTGAEYQADSSTGPRIGIDYRCAGSSPKVPVVLRVLPGGQADWFDATPFYGSTYHISPTSNRMGLRCRGLPIPKVPKELLSEPVAPGAIQVSHDGQPMILGIDGQTIGGYPKIAHVIQADWDRLGQLRPHDEVRFVPVRRDDARRAWLEQQAQLASWERRLDIYRRTC